MRNMKNSQLKRIEFKGRTFYYYAKTHASHDYDWEKTYFYESNDKYKVVPRYPILNFLGVITETKVITNNKLLFELSINIEEPRHSKRKVKEYINEKVELLNRKTEIDNGEII